MGLQGSFSLWVGSRVEHLCVPRSGCVATYGLVFSPYTYSNTPPPLNNVHLVPWVITASDVMCSRQRGTTLVFFNHSLLFIVSLFISLFIRFIYLFISSTRYVIIYFVLWVCNKVPAVI